MRGKNKWAIDPLGNLRTCEQNPEILGNLFEKSFSELAIMPEVEKFINKNYKSDCKTCSDFKNCGGGCRILRRKF